MWSFLKKLGGRRRPKVGLALSGGGARGLAHVGVLKALEEHGIPIDVLAGTSMGGVIAAGYAAGFSPNDIEVEARRLASIRQLIGLVDRTVPRGGLLQGNKLTEYFCEWVGDKTFDQLRCPLGLVAVDIKGQKRVVLREGSVVEAMRASMSIPGLFAPVERDGQLLVDGGLMDNLPAGVVRELGADVVIAVDLSFDEAMLAYLVDHLHSRLLPGAVSNTMEVIVRSLVALTMEMNRRSLQENPPDLLVRPAIPVGVTILTGFTRAEEIIAAGYEAANAALPRITSVVESGRR